MLYIWNPNLPLFLAKDQEFSAAVKNPENLLWLELEGDSQGIRETLEAIGLFHQLTLERILLIEPRPFLDEFDEYIHILLQENHYNPEDQIELRECHFILGTNYFISFHESPISAIESIKEKPPVRFFSQGSDVLFYHLAGPLIGASFSVLDSIADRSEDVEGRMFPKPDRNLLNELFLLKKDLITLRKSLAPMREVFSLLSRRENPFVDVEALPFMSHLYDQLIRLHEISDTQREIVTGALEIYLSTVSNRMNEVMMTLTIVSTLILPPTLIVGYYGMNFKHFPELHWRIGSFFVLFLIICSTLGLLWFFKKRHWF